ncbi:uncharacterized protein LOC130034995 [Sorex fumeus]|uniref:uncharacterized protein LOC130034995 n=1 Tax=Sorex fumeus TaxID=62283 RepID=UPI0024ACBC9C|nr:uncharacterized protein LOC130034995 [Sorex fumeus]
MTQRSKRRTSSGSRALQEKGLQRQEPGTRTGRGERRGRVGCLAQRDAGEKEEEARAATPEPRDRVPGRTAFSLIDTIAQLGFSPPPPSIPTLPHPSRRPAAAAAPAPARGSVAGCAPSSRPRSARCSPALRPPPRAPRLSRSARLGGAAASERLGLTAPGSPGTLGSCLAARLTPERLLPRPQSFWVCWNLGIQVFFSSLFSPRNLRAKLDKSTALSPLALSPPPSFSFSFFLNPRAEEGAYEGWGARLPLDKVFQSFPSVMVAERLIHQLIHGFIPSPH